MEKNIYGFILNFYFEKFKNMLNDEIWNIYDKNSNNDNDQNFNNRILYVKSIFEILNNNSININNELIIFLINKAENISYEFENFKKGKLKKNI